MARGRRRWTYASIGIVGLLLSALMIVDQAPIAAASDSPAITTTVSDSVPPDLPSSDPASDDDLVTADNLVTVIVQLESNATDIDAAAAAGIEQTGGELVQVFEHALPGYAIRVPVDQIEQLQQQPGVVAASPDTPVYAVDTQSPAPWNLDRVDEVGLPLDNSYQYGSAGSGVMIYVLDGGVRVTHSQFSGRAVNGPDFTGSAPPAADCLAHGTHVAATAAGKSYGIARSAWITSIRVLSCAGQGMASEVIAGVDWILKNRPGNEKSVINVSLSGGVDGYLDAAFNRAIAAGIPVIAAAGNKNQTACSASPGRLTKAITVGATDRNDHRASFSNYGSCVDLWAPGVDIVSAGSASNSAKATLSGTSMSAPLVTGAVARFLGENPSATPAQVDLWLKSSGSAAVIDARSSCDRVLFLPMTTSMTGSGPTILGTKVSGSACAVQGSNAGMTATTITGWNLADTNSVQVGGVPASFTVNSANSITVTTPAVSFVGRVPVTVTTSTGTNADTPAASFTYYFRDVGPSSPFFREINQLVTQGAIHGYADGTYRPANAISRGAFAVILYRNQHPGAADPVCPSGSRVFRDVPRASSQCGAIEWLASTGIARGYSGGTYRPADSISRAAMSAMLLRMMEGSTTDPDCWGKTRMFSDVPRGYTFCGPIEWLADRGIVTGYADGKFRPAANVSRAAIAAFLTRVNGFDL